MRTSAHSGRVGHGAAARPAENRGRKRRQRTPGLDRPPSNPELLDNQQLFAKMHCTGPGELSAYLVEGSIGFSPNASFMNMSSQTASPNSLVGGLRRKVR